MPSVLQVFCDYIAQSNLASDISVKTLYIIALV